MTAYAEFSTPILDYISTNFPGATVEQWEHEKKESLNFNILENEKTFVLRVMHECLVDINVSEVEQLLENYNAAQVLRDIGDFPIVVTNMGCIFGSP